eukprot:scaffold2226_cov38-Prasinocladus_malaysianus.AAC.1
MMPRKNGSPPLALLRTGRFFSTGTGGRRLLDAAALQPLGPDPPIRPAAALALSVNPRSGGTLKTHRDTRTPSTSQSNSQANLESK